MNPINQTPSAITFLKTLVQATAITAIVLGVLSLLANSGQSLYVPSSLYAGIALGGGVVALIVRGVIGHLRKDPPGKVEKGITTFVECVALAAIAVGAISLLHLQGTGVTLKTLPAVLTIVGGGLGLIILFIAHAFQSGPPSSTSIPDSTQGAGAAVAAPPSVPTDPNDKPDTLRAANSTGTALGSKDPSDKPNPTRAADSTGTALAGDASSGAAAVDPHLHAAPLPPLIPVPPGDGEGVVA